MTLRHRQAPPHLHDHASALAPDAEDRIWEEVQRRIDLGSSGRPALRRPPAARPTTTALVAAACAVVLLAGLLLARPGSDRDVVAGPDAAAIATSAVLDELAATAAAVPPVVLDATHPALRIVTEGRPMPGQDGVRGWTREDEVRGDGAGRARIGPPTDDLGELGPFADHEAGTLGVAGLVPDAIATLPSDPEALLDALRVAHRSEGGPWRPAERIADLLALPIVPPAVRAGLIRLLGRLGAEVGEPTTDALGRTGLRLTVHEADGDSTEIIIDLVTARALSRRVDGPHTNRLAPQLTIYHVAEPSAG